MEIAKQVGLSILDQAPISKQSGCKYCANTSGRNANELLRRDIASAHAMLSNRLLRPSLCQVTSAVLD